MYKKSLNMRFRFLISAVSIIFMLLLVSEPIFAASVAKTKGKITGISRKAKTISIQLKNSNSFTVTFNDQTIYKNAKSYKSLKTKDAIKIKYKVSKGENIAVEIERALVKLPAGVKEIKTTALVKLMKKPNSLVLIDARPQAMYEQSHIPGAVSVPYSKLIKLGKKLLPFPKEKLLVFYCGGDT